MHKQSLLFFQTPEINKGVKKQQEKNLFYYNLRINICKICINIWKCKNKNIHTQGNIVKINEKKILIPPINNFFYYYQLCSYLNIQILKKYFKLSQKNAL